MLIFLIILTRPFGKPQPIGYHYVGEHSGGGDARYNNNGRGAGYNNDGGGSNSVGIYDHATYFASLTTFNFVSGAGANGGGKRNVKPIASGKGIVTNSGIKPQSEKTLSS